MPDTLNHINDPGIARINFALDPTAMAERFAQILLCQHGRDPAWHIEKISITRVKYKPGRNCLIGYRVILRDQNTHQRSEHLLTGRIYRPGEIVSRYCRARMETLHPAGPFPGLFTLDELDMLVWSFPNDRKLLHLYRLADNDYIRTQVVPALLEVRWGSGVAAHNIHSEIIHYAAEHACTVRVNMDLVAKDNRREQSWVVFGKTYYDHAGEHAFQTMQQVWSAFQGKPVAASSARPLFYQPAIRTLWQEGLQGKSLHGTDWLNEDNPLLHHAVRALHAIHRLHIKNLPVTDIDARILQLRQRSQRIGQAVPELNIQLQTVVRRLCLQAAAARQCASVTLHGDLHPQNLFAMQERIALIDLDQLSTGPVAMDLGSWTACCLYHACLKRQSFEQGLYQAHLFVDAYRASPEVDVSAQALDWFTALALVDERVYRCLSRLKRGRLDIMPTLVNWAERISNQAAEDRHS